jgi:hypothetical protein
VSRAAVFASPEPHDVIKALDPCALSGTIFALPDPCNISMGASNPLGILLPHSRDVWSPLARQGAMGVLTMAPISTDRTDMTTYSEQERGNRALTQHDPGHSTTTMSIPLQRRGNGNNTTYPPLYANPSACIAHPRCHRSTQDEAWP